MTRVKVSYVKSLGITTDGRVDMTGKVMAPVEGTMFKPPTKGERFEVIIGAQRFRTSVVKCVAEAGDRVWEIYTERSVYVVRAVPQVSRPPRAA